MTCSAALPLLLRPSQSFGVDRGEVWGAAGGVVPKISAAEEAVGATTAGPATDVERLENESKAEVLLSLVRMGGGGGGARG